MTQGKHIEDMKRAAEIIEHEPFIGICAGGFPIRADRCEFCGATWEDRCGRVAEFPTSRFR